MAKPTTPARDPIVAARVDGVEILTDEVDARIDPTTKKQIADGADPAVRATARRRVVDELIDNQLFMAAAVKANIDVGPGEIDAALAEIKKQNGDITDAQLEEAIRAAGMNSMEDYRRDLRDQIMRLRYLNGVGGLPAEERIRKELRAKAKIEIYLAEGTPEPKEIANSLGVGSVITAAELAKVVGHALPELETGPMEGPPSTATYDSWRLRPKGTEGGLVIRVWRLAGKELDAKWKDLLETLPQNHSLTGLADSAMALSDAGQSGVGFVDHKASIVVLVVCSKDLCATEDTAVAVAKLFHSRWGQLKH